MAANKPTRVLLLGYPYFVNRLRELGEGSGYQFSSLPGSALQRWLALLNSDLVYLIGGDLRPNRFFRSALRLGKKVIIHWVGSDILEMQKWQAQGGKFCQSLLTQAVHWAEVDWTARELTQLGVEPAVVPLTPTGFPEEVKALPSKFVVLTYLPPGKEEFYGWEKIKRLAIDFPKVVFLAAAASPSGNHPADWPENIIPLGWVDNMAELYREVIALIRLTEHDGLSFMVLEALAHGRHVIWSYPLEGVNQATDYTRLKQIMDKLVDDFGQGRLTVNESGREMVRNRYSPAAVWEQIQNGIEATLTR